MKPIPARLSHRLGQLAAATLLVVLFGGCAMTNRFNSKHDTTFGPKKEVENVNQTILVPKGLRRVALLPLHRGSYDYIDMEPIEQNFVEELNKRNLFEVVAVSREDMKELFGSESYSSVERLPTKLLKRLYEVYAIDGVMFVDVTYYRGFQPVGLGIRAKLLDGHTGKLVWSADETFDAADPKVSNAARKYFQTQSVRDYPLSLQTQTVLHSPTRFSKYVAHAVFSAIR